MDQTRREYRSRRAVRPDRPGRHRAAVGPSVRARRVVAAVLVGLAAGSAAIGAARAQETSVRVSGALVGPIVTPSPTDPEPTATQAPTSAATPSQSRVSAATTSSAPRSAASTKAATARSKLAVPERGSGKLRPVRVPGADTAGSGRVVTYAFDIEDGLGVDRDAAARLVGATLRDPRGWQKVDRVRFVQISPGARAKGASPDVVITLASPSTTDRLCAPLQTEGTWSCANKDRAVINYKRWVRATPTFAAKSVRDYRSYVVNHEVGHELGHGHVGCPRKSSLAPVMLQQSMGLEGCKPNIWPSVTRG